MKGLAGPENIHEEHNCLVRVAYLGGILAEVAGLSTGNLTVTRTRIGVLQYHV